jgi:Domain of unknown function (DUF5122) beta-propeller/Secretion system C-terminal sorting domain
MKSTHITLVALTISSVVRAQTPLGLDTNFRQTAITVGGVSAIYPTSDGSVFISGYWRLWPGADLDWHTWGRILPNGNNDTNPLLYGPSGGDIIFFENHYYTGPSTRYDLNGIWDVSYGNRPYCPWPVPNFIGAGTGQFTIQPDGRLVVAAGGDQLGPYGVNPPGFYGAFRGELDYNCGDSTFHQLPTNDVAWCIQSLEDGRMLVSGYFTQVDGQSTGSLVRIWPDGQWDSTFHSPITGQYRGYPEAFLVQADGRIVLGGAFMIEGVQDTVGLMRILPDGALDTTFHYTTTFRFTDYPQFILAQSTVRDVEQLDDGRLLVVGNFTTVDGHQRRGIAMMDSTGHLVLDKFNGSGFGKVKSTPDDTQLYMGITDINKAPDGSLYICGGFHGFDDGITNDTNQRMICKLYGLHVGVQEQQRPVTWFTLSPNPTTDHVTVAYALPNSALNAAVVVYTLDGREVKRLAVSNQAQQVSLDLHDLAAGSYSVVLQNAGKLAGVQRLVVTP